MLCDYYYFFPLYIVHRVSCTFVTKFCTCIYVKGHMHLDVRVLKKLFFSSFPRDRSI